VKVRVYELAHELGVESKTLLSILKDMGEFVRSASSTVDAHVERRLKERLAGMTTDEGQRLRRSGPARSTLQGGLPRHLQVVDPGLPKDPTEPKDWPSTRPLGQSRPGTNPFTPRPEPRPPADLDELMAASWQPTTRRPSSRTRRPPKVEPKPAPDRWAKEFFEVKDRQEWQSAGVYDPIVAKACTAKKLRPEDLSERVAGRRISDRLRGGEPLAVILALREEERRFREGA